MQESEIVSIKTNPENIHRHARVVCRVSTLHGSARRREAGRTPEHTDTRDTHSRGKRLPNSNARNCRSWIDICLWHTSESVHRRARSTTHTCNTPINEDTGRSNPM